MRIGDDSGGAWARKSPRDYSINSSYSPAPPIFPTIAWCPDYVDVQAWETRSEVSGAPPPGFRGLAKSGCRPLRRRFGYGRERCKPSQNNQCGHMGKPHESDRRAFHLKAGCFRPRRWRAFAPRPPATAVDQVFNGPLNVWSPKLNDLAKRQKTLSVRLALNSGAVKCIGRLATTRLRINRRSSPTKADRWTASRLDVLDCATTISMLRQSHPKFVIAPTTA
jgi:hypothetical protein